MITKRLKRKQTQRLRGEEKMSKVMRVEKNENYTCMGNYHLRDMNLSLKSKGLLSLMLSLPPNWDYSIRGLVSICKDGIDCVRNSLVELEKHGYITRKRLKLDNGKFGKTEYIIMEKPTQENPILEKPTQEKPMQENPTQLNIDIPNTEKINKELLNTQSIREQVDYDILIQRHKHSKGEIDGMIEIIKDVLTSNSERIFVGEWLTARLVKERFLKITCDDLERVLQKYKAVTDPITNPHNYMLRMLYNQPILSDLEVRNEVSVDWGGG
jgi:hypothetical protein